MAGGGLRGFVKQYSVTLVMIPSIFRESFEISNILLVTKAFVSFFPFSDALRLAKIAKCSVLGVKRGTRQSQALQRE